MVLYFVVSYPLLHVLVRFNEKKEVNLKVSVKLTSLQTADGEVSGGGARPKDSGIYEQPPKWFTAYMSKVRTFSFHILLLFDTIYIL